MSNPQCPDVLIIGCGPAGSATAISCAQRGLSTAIVDSLKFPRERPGETFHPGMEPLLKQLGVAEKVNKAGFLRHEGNWVQWEGKGEFVPFGADESGNWQGFQAWRADFDAILLDRARELGVTVLQPCQAKEAIIDNNRVVGVETSNGSIYASVTVDAAGSRHWLARQLGMEIIPYSPRLTAYYGYAQGECPVRDDIPAIVADDLGWTWTARVRPQLYQWTRLFFPQSHLEPKIKESKTEESGTELKTELKLEKDWIPAEFVGLVPQGNIRRADVTWRSVATPAGEGYFIVGDAATVLDPASSHGVLKALMSGIMTGHLITQVKQGYNEDLAAEAYCRWVGEWFQQDVKRLRELYGKIPQRVRSKE